MNKMGKTKFKVGDEVKIVSNEIQPQFCGKIGKVKKVYMTFSEKEEGGQLHKMALYRISVGAVTLNGVACDSDLEAV